MRRLIRRLLRFSDLDLTAHVELFEGRPPQVDSLGLLLVLVILGAAGLAAVAVPRSPIALALVAVLATLAVLATSHYRHPRCSAPACQSPLTRDAAACPRCGAVIAGDLDSADQRLAAEQALRDR